MSARRGRAPSAEELAQWHAVAHTTKPLAGRALTKPARPEGKPHASEPPPRTAAATPRPATPAKPVRAARAPAIPALEPALLRKLKRGRVAIEGRVDLHGHTASSAHQTLAAFLAQAQLRGYRVVLVVTGKGDRRARPDTDDLTAGETGRGVIKRALPHWLASPPMASMVIGMAEAAPAHGGTGATYVLLRRAARR